MGPVEWGRYWGNRCQREGPLMIGVTVIESVNGVMMIYDDNDDHSDAIDKKKCKYSWAATIYAIRYPNF